MPALLVAVVAGCSPASLAASPSSSQTATPDASSAAALSQAPTIQPGGLLVTEVAEGNGFSTPAWSPDGKMFVVTWGWGMPSPGEADIYSADGRELTRLPNGEAVAWLDSSTLAVQEGLGQSVNGSVIVYSIASGASRVATSASSGILGSATARLAIMDPIDSDPVTPFDPRFRVFGQDATSQPGSPGWPNPMEFDGEPQAWSPDASELAIRLESYGAIAPEPVRGAIAISGGATDQPQLGAGNYPPGRLAVRRFPGGTLVPTPDLLYSPFADWNFSPNGRFLALGGVDTPTAVIDTTTGRLTPVADRHAGWTPGGQLVLVPDNAPASLWAPDGSITSTELSVGTPTYGPLAGEVFVNPPFNQGTQESAVVRIGDRTATIPLSLSVPGATASWAPDGSACYVATLGDDAQLLDARLYRVSLP